MPIKNFKIKIVSGIFIGFSLIACSNNNPAPIRSIGDANKTKSASQAEPTAASDYVPPPKIVKAKEAATKSAPVTQSSSSAKTTVVKKQEQGNITYNRNYSDIPKGGYQGDSYTVKRGDTLFYIAWITGNDYRALANKNNIAEPYQLSVGQVLDVSGTTDKVAPEPVQKSTPQVPVTTKPVVVTPPVTTPTINNTSSTVGNIAWRWPTVGKVIDKFSDVAGGNKGIDISGTRGQDVIAAASGRVVYAGNALRGYGNLIIVKHNDDYLSAYAHNDKLLVTEQQDVKAGQKIATMGDSGATSVRLHFEIRYKGKSMNPEQYLPQNNGY